MSHQCAIRTGPFACSPASRKMSPRSTKHRNCWWSARENSSESSGLPDVTWTADRQGSYSYISPRVEKVLGYSNHEIYAARPGFLHSRIHPDDKDRVHQAYAALFDEKKIFDEE